MGISVIIHGPGPHYLNNSPSYQSGFSAIDEIKKKKDKSKKLQTEGETLLKNAKTKEDFLKAKEIFENAWKEDNSEINLSNRIKETDCWIHLETGNELFNSKDFLNASNEYSKALSYAEIGNLSSLKQKCNDLLEKSKNEIIKIENEKLEKLKKEEIEKKKIEEEKLLQKQKELEEERKRIDEEIKRNEELNKQRTLVFEKIIKEEKVKMLNEIREREYLEKKQKERRINQANFLLDQKSKNLICKEKEKLKIKLLDNQKYKKIIKNYILSNNDLLIKSALFQNSKKNIATKLSHILNNLLKQKEINILLIGETGVGKSTLINSILQLPPERQAETGSVKPCTMGNPKFYSSDNPDLENINLIDTRGYEKDKGYLINKMEKEIINFINNQKLTERPIHLIWYCFKGSRFEDKEDLLIQNVLKLNIPVLLVYTQAVTNTIMDFESLRNKGYEYLEIIAKDMGKSIKSFGLNELKEKTNEYLNNNYTKILKDITICQFIDFTKNKLLTIENYFNRNLGNINFANFISKAIGYLFENNNIDNNLLNYMKNFSREFLKIIQKYVLSFIYANDYDMINSLINLQQNINFENDGILTNLKNRNQWKNIIVNQLQNDFIKVCFDDAIYKIYPILLNNFIKYLAGACRDYLDQNFQMNDDMFIVNFK